MKDNLRVLFVSGELIAGDVAYRLKKEGCDVKLYIEDESRKDCFDGMVEKTDDWKKELDWVGKDGLIVFDDVGYGRIQDKLRKDGYSVVGGCEMGDRLEEDREFGQKILSDYCNVEILPSKNFDSLDEAIEFIKRNKKKWVVKQDGHINVLNYVGSLEDGSDAINVIESYKSNKDVQSISLQERVDGIEIGVARYFNGSDWVGPVEINVEHKGLFNDNIGPKTAEMGTVMWYENDDNFKLYQETLEKLKPFLKENDFRGDVDIDFIINEKGVYPLELTTRFGCPAIHLQDEIHISKWKDFLFSVARGEDFELEYNKGVGVVVCVSIPPFPYRSINNDYYYRGVGIFFDKNLTQDELNRVHFEEVSFDQKMKKYCIAGSNGFILYLTGFGPDIYSARREAYDLLKKIIVPKMFYRTDIGLKFFNGDYSLLKNWNWIN